MDGGHRSPSVLKPDDFQRIFHATASPQLIVSAEFEIVGVNDAYLRATMTRREEILGRDLFDVFPDNPDDPDAQSVRNLKASLERVLATGKPDTMAVQKYDIPRPRELGGGFEERWWHPVNTPVFGRDGGIDFVIHSVTDATAQMRMAAGKRESEEELRKFKFLTDHANDGHLVLDQEGRIRYANKLFGQRLGYSESELLRMYIWDVSPLYPKPLFQELFARTKDALIPPFEAEHRHKNGSKLPVEVSAVGVEFNGEWQMFATARDITERKLAEKRAREAALHDPLTSLPNRALVFEHCDRLLAAAQRNHSRGALLFIDLDRFKPINDFYGHEIGDRVLRDVAKRLSNCTRDEDLVGRLAGDEFIIVLPHLEPDSDNANLVAQHVVEVMNRPFRVDALELSISTSIGISYFPEHAIETTALLHAADLAMYQAKQAGRAGYHVYTPGLEQRADQALSVEVRLKSALRESGLSLHYQPIIDIRSGQLAGVEALLRLVDDRGEAVGPERFIPVAESAGLIGALGDWVMAEACRQHQAWLQEGMKINIAINVSPLQFKQRSFADKLSSIIAEHGIDPACLEIELTESAVMENVAEAVGILKRIKALGVRLALDDFGTGYSSLSSLTSLPFDKLKIDQSFVLGIENDQASRVVTEAIIALARSLKLEVVGEGIESEEALRYLETHACDQAQGYWVSKPLAPAEFSHWYRQRIAS